jgi:hypothetical protein
MKSATALILSTVAALLSLSAFAGTGCDCSKLLDQCGAMIKPAGTDIQIKTNTRRCAQVTWFADDMAYNTVVENGKSLEPSKFKSSPFLSIASCNICANTHPQSVNNASAGESAECKKRKKNLKLSEKYYAQGRITPYEYQLSKDMVQKHCK